MRAAPLTLLLWLGCTEPRRPPAGPVDTGAPLRAAPPRADAGTEAEWLEREVTLLLAQRCTPCHAWTPQALVATRSACRGGQALVVPFDASASPLYRKLSGPPLCGAMMPPTGRLPPGAAEVVRAWIQAGAPVGGQVSMPLPPEPPTSTLDWAPDPN